MLSLHTKTWVRWKRKCNSSRSIRIIETSSSMGPSLRLASGHLYKPATSWLSYPQQALSVFYIIKLALGEFKTFIFQGCPIKWSGLAPTFLPNLTRYSVCVLFDKFKSHQVGLDSPTWFLLLCLNCFTIYRLWSRVPVKAEGQITQKPCDEPENCDIFNIYIFLNIPRN